MSGEKYFSNTDLAVFCRQTMLVIKTGVPLSAGIDFFKSETDIEDDMTGVVEGVFSSVGNGSSFSGALESTGKFPKHLISMVRLGEKTGNLERAMKNLALYYELSERVRQKAVSAITYPLILLTIMIFVIIFLVVKVLPQFSDILASVGGQMPASAAVILGFGRFLENQWIYLLIGSMAFAIGSWFFGSSSSGRRFFGKLIFRLPLTRGAAQKLATVRFCTGMSMALGSGVDFAGAVAITSTIMENSYMTEKLEQMKKLIDNNVAISDAAQKIELFPPVFVKLFNTAYKAGEIDDLLLRMSEYYEDSLENSLHKITAAIEPTLVIILTAIVGAILFSVMLPIINIMQLIG